MASIQVKYIAAVVGVISATIAVSEISKDVHPPGLKVEYSTCVDKNGVVRIGTGATCQSFLKTQDGLTLE